MDDVTPLISQAQSALALAGVEPKPGDADAAREFEGYLLRVLLGEMRRTVKSGGLFDGRATQGYQLMLDEALTRQMAERGGFGLAQQMLQQWEKLR
jgi:Rod binding domain-containing protein